MSIAKKTLKKLLQHTAIVPGTCNTVDMDH